MSDNEKVIHALSGLLADSYTLYLKTHNYHWNVTGPQFVTLHGMFEKHYNELALAVDQIAERIRALGHAAPGSYRAFSRLSVIEEEEEDSVTPRGTAKHWHIFHVVAKKT